jgi:hypothetical protein
VGGEDMAGPSLAIMVIKIATKKMQRYWNQINTPILSQKFTLIAIIL